jgi:hypothetical protein
MPKSHTPSADTKAAMLIVACRREMVNVSRRCERRVKYGEAPLEEDIERLAQLREEIAKVKRGEFFTQEEADSEF